MHRSYSVFIDYAQNISIAHTSAGGRVHKVRLHRSQIPYGIAATLTQLISGTTSLNRGTNSAGFAVTLDRVADLSFHCWFDTQVINKEVALKSKEEVVVQIQPVRGKSRYQSALETGMILPRPSDWGGFREEELCGHPDAYIEGVPMSSENYFGG